MSFKIGETLNDSEDRQELNKQDASFILSTDLPPIVLRKCRCRKNPGSNYGLIGYLHTRDYYCQRDFDVEDKPYYRVWINLDIEQNELEQDYVTLRPDAFREFFDIYGEHI